MSQRDSLDDLLQRAFETDRARTPGVDVADRVVERLRSRQRLRLGVLAGVVIAGMLVLTVSVQPALDTLLEALLRSLPLGGQDHALLPGLLAVIVATWLMLMDEELG